jgi:hypothetical protein
MFRSLPFLLCGAVLLGSQALVGCGESQEWESVKKESGEAWDAAKTWGIARRQDAERLLSNSLDTLRRDVEDAKANARATGGTTADGMNSKWDDVSRKFAEMQAAGADRWAEAKDAFVRAYEGLKREVSEGRRP